jgi:hypothetical protein
MGPTALLPLNRKERCGFLQPLKIHRLLPGLNSRISDQMASLLTTKPPRTTETSRYFSGHLITLLSLNFNGKQFDKDHTNGHIKNHT